MKLGFLTVAALAAASTVSAADSTTGWRILEGITGSFCLHNALLPGNKLMCIERPHTHPYPFINPNTNGTTAVLISIDTNKGSISYALNSIQYNAFCAGHSQAADGGIHVVGGDRQMSSTTHDASTQADPSVEDNGTFLRNGIDRIRKYTPNADGTVGKWDESVQMTTPRWYPTVLTMGDGDLFIASGGQKNIVFEDLTNTNNPTYEFYPSRYAPAIHSQVLEWAFPHNLYPVAFQLPGGKVFMMVSNRTVLIDPSVDPQGAKELNTVEIASLTAKDHAPWIYPHTPTSFMLPLKESNNYTATIVVCGGSKQSNFMASADCYSIQPEVANSAWTALPNMPNGRLMPEATLLPDGTVLLTNGMGWGQAGGNAGDAQYAAAPVFPTDLYDPVANSWSTVGKSKIARSYHNGAILLSDGSVITTGNEMANYLDFWGTDSTIGPLAAFAKVEGVGAKPNCYPSNQAGICTTPWEYRIEQFTPAYVNKGSRPVISPIAAGTKFTYGSTVGIQLDPKGASVSRITFIRYTTTTHSTNTDQRFIEPNLLFVNSTYAVVKIPPNGNIAPPGNWHIFALSKDGVPSISETALFGAGIVTNVPVPTKSGVFKGTSSIAVFVAVLAAVVLAL
ncbi:UNVERIFIED_CONTAM: hypothetical protein HDU68_002948 [Siphonaria sp. JEL0065]|nr:hypothetical protein HDU68_002948 [Siphonaria sp. JEL0065]